MRSQKGRPLQGWDGRTQVGDRHQRLTRASEGPSFQCWRVPAGNGAQGGGADEPQGVPCGPTPWQYEISHVPSGAAHFRGRAHGGRGSNELSSTAWLRVVACQAGRGERGALGGSGRSRIEVETQGCRRRMRGLRVSDPGP